MSIGEWSPGFSSILLSIIFNILNQCFYGMNNNEAFETIKFFKKSHLSNNILIHYFFNYALIALIWAIFNLYEDYIIKKKKRNNNSNKKNEKYQLIHYNSEGRMKNSKVLLISLLISFLWCVEEFCIQCFNVFFKDIDTWMFELFFFVLFNKLIFKKNIYKHQWLAIFISLGSFLLKIISIILTLTSNKKYVRFEGDLPILYSIKWYILILGWLFYLILILLRASVNIGLKWLMEKKYISINRILMIYGMIGSICSFICIFASDFPCGKRYFEEFGKEGGTNFSISDYICTVYDNNTNESSTEEYLTNYDYYLTEWIGNWKFETSAIFFWAITFFFFKYYSIMIIKNLSPAHFIFSIPIAFFFQKIINILYSINNDVFSEQDKEDIKKNKFILDILGDVITIIGLLIYLEIIVLHFCGFDYNIKVNIINRSSKDINNEPDETVYLANDIEGIFNEDKDEDINEDKDEDINEDKDEKNDENKNEDEINEKD